MSSDADTSGRMSTDVVFEILSNTRRRMVLYYLRQKGGSVTVQELAEQIAALENDIPVDELQNQQRKRVYVSLYQTHIPKLEETGIIDYDDMKGEVRLTNRASEIDSYLTPTTESAYPWQLHYIAVASIGAVVFLLSFVGVPGFAAIPTAVIGAGLMLAFAISAAVQYWRSKQQQREIPAELLEHNQ